MILTRLESVVDLNDLIDAVGIILNPEVLDLLIYHNRRVTIRALIISQGGKLPIE